MTPKEGFDLLPAAITKGLVLLPTRRINIAYFSNIFFISHRHIQLNPENEDYIRNIRDLLQNHEIYCDNKIK